VTAAPPLLLAVSGGIDSVAMLHQFRERPDTGCAHVHHGLRGNDADADLAFVRERCAEWGIPFYSKHVDVQAAAEGASIEDTARRLRYRALADIALAQGYTHVATAHTADDNAETLLLHLIRGSGLRGLTGIQPERPLADGMVLVRPLLDTTRREVEAYARLHGLSWRVDGSNRDTVYTRNKIRHEIMPLLREINPNATAALHETAKRLTGDAAALEGLAFQYAEALTPHALRTLPPALADRAVRAWVRHRRPGVFLGAAHSAALIHVFIRHAPTGAVTLPGGVTAKREGDALWLEDTPPRNN
jgi:tRNA(Ile)-lysidine synthase